MGALGCMLHNRRAEIPNKNREYSVGNPRTSFVVDRGLMTGAASRLLWMLAGAGKLKVARTTCDSERSHAANWSIWRAALQVQQGLFSGPV